jgi:hypothetical protein
MRCSALHSSSLVVFSIGVEPVSSHMKYILCSPPLGINEPKDTSGVADVRAAPTPPASRSTRHLKSTRWTTRADGLTVQFWHTDSWVDKAFFFDIHALQLYLERPSDCDKSMENLFVLSFFLFFLSVCSFATMYAADTIRM